MNHAYKVLSHIILSLIKDQIDDILPDSQNGFRSDRNGDDNTVQLQWLVERVHEEGRRVLAVFIDFKDAFSSISHSFMMKCLKDVGISRKIRVIISEIYKGAQGSVRLRQADGSYEYSKPFEISRGVLQGDIFSPLVFILGLSKLLKQSNLQQHAGARISTIIPSKIVSSEYVDDASFFF